MAPKLAPKKKKRSIGCSSTSPLPPPPQPSQGSKKQKGSSIGGPSTGALSCSPDEKMGPGGSRDVCICGLCKCRYNYYNNVIKYSWSVFTSASCIFFVQWNLDTPNNLKGHGSQIMDKL